MLCCSVLSFSDFVFTRTSSREQYFISNISWYCMSEKNKITPKRSNNLSITFYQHITHPFPKLLTQCFPKHIPSCSLRWNSVVNSDILRPLDLREKVRHLDPLHDVLLTCRLSWEDSHWNLSMYYHQFFWWRWIFQNTDIIASFFSNWDHSTLNILNWGYALYWAFRSTTETSHNPPVERWNLLCFLSSW